MDNYKADNLLEQATIQKILKVRDPFTHKGNYGHACLITGSIGLMGAASLAVKACVRSGAGKVTAYIPKIGYDILQIAVPEAMTKIAGEDYILSVESLKKYDSVGIGPGIGIYESHKNLLHQIFSEFKKPIVVDADALNILSQNKDLLKLLPANSILTPHLVEFQRLSGITNSPEEAEELALRMAALHKVYIILKGHHTLIATPDNKAFFNTTGNAGMATGGSGDVLTGILTGLLAQGYSSEHTALLGVYLHGLAGDFAAKKYTQHAMIAGDIIDNLGEAFKIIGEK